MVDYSLYLVTDRGLLPDGKAYSDSLKEALNGGVTVVQVREKTAETGEFLQVALESKRVCDSHKPRVPLIINDRIDIALAVDADGVHLGQTDMPMDVARRLLPPGKIIGVSCNNVDQVRKAVEDGADYIGIGAVWATNTKKLTSPTLDVQGVMDLLEALYKADKSVDRVKAVVIGGIKTSNVSKILEPVSKSAYKLDGVAVVSEIVASSDPNKSTKGLRQAFTPWSAAFRPAEIKAPSDTGKDHLGAIKDGAANLLRLMRETKPLFRFTFIFLSSFIVLRALPRGRLYDMLYTKFV